MWKSVRALWKIRKKEFYIYISLTGIVWIFGNLFTGAMKAGTQLPGALPFATMLAAFGGIIMCVIAFGTEVFYGYDFYLRFGHTRKEFLFVSGIVTFFQSLIMVVELKIFLELEMLISHSLFSGSPGTRQLETAISIFSDYVSIPWLPVYGLLITGLSCAGGAFIHRFHTRGGWILVFLWLLAAGVLPKIIQTPWFHEAAGNILKTAMVIQLFFGALIGGALYLAGVFGLRKAGVN
mgnify:FL=1